MSSLQMDLLAAPFFAAAGLLVASGVAKIRRPESAEQALAGLRLPSRRSVVWTIGGLEVLIGAWCLLSTSTISALALAALFVAFALFLLAQMKAGTPAASCGCLGSADAPPSLIHVGLDLVAATSGALMAIDPPRGLIPFAGTLPLWGVPFLLGTALIAYLSYLVVAFAPKAIWSYDRPDSAERSSSPQRFALRQGDR